MASSSLHTSSTPGYPLPALASQAIPQGRPANPMKPGKRIGGRHFAQIADDDPNTQTEERGVRIKYPDILPEHWLVESPRKLQFERTTLTVTSRLGAILEQFYADVARIPDKYIVSAKSRTKTLTDWIIPRIKKLGNQSGIKILGWRHGGSTVDNTQVVLPREIDIFVLFEKYKIKSDSVEPGYRIIPLRKFRQKEGEKRDQYRFGRSDEGTHLSSLTVAKNIYDLIDRSLKLNPQVELQPFTIADDTPQIVVTFKNKHRFNFIPAMHLDTDDVYLTTRPYAYDSNPWAPNSWRINYIDKEKRLIEMMNKADRGTRHMAFLILKALVKTEHTLQGLTSYHIKTVLLHVFDMAVDGSPRWQKDTLESAFLALLRELLYFLRSRNLPHFYIRGYNLFKNMPTRTLNSLMSRVAFLLENRNELVRILGKRTI